MNNLPYKKRRWSKYIRYIANADFHLHTNFTDGKSKPRDYFFEANKRGIKLLVFSEHVRKKLDYNFNDFVKEVKKSNINYKIKALIGIETKVLDINGNLDVAKNISEGAEIVLFAFHSLFFKTKDEYFKSLINTIKNPLVDIWAHPTNYHQKYLFDFSETEWTKICQTLAEEGVAYEINKKYGFPKKNQLIQILKYKVSIVFGSDAHIASSMLSQNEIHKLIKRI